MDIVEVAFDLNREKAILMILKTESRKDFEYNIDCSELIDSKNIIEDIENKLDYEISHYKNDIYQKVKELKIIRKQLNDMMTWEVYEYGENLGLWKLNERQKRLI